ncbi:MAG: carbohydrate ABC transporter permease [Oscillospiraceae bacterium]|nr:carbohydrate ABC transporter permease [Oscillospiraceae bacterium]
MSRKQKKRIGTIITVIAVILIVLVMDIGLITNVLTAFKSPFTISSSPPKWIFKPTLDNFRNVLGKGSFDFRLYLWNSFIIAVISSSIAIILTIPAAYSIVRYHGVGDLILGSTMLLRLAPALAFAIPVFLIFNRFKLLDTKIAIIFMHTLFITPTSLLLFIGYIQDLPK